MNVQARWADRLLAPMLFTMLLVCACAASETFLMGEVAQRDPTRPIYEVSFPKLGDTSAIYAPVHDAATPVGIKSMRMVTARGQVMNCQLPSPEPTPEATAHVSAENRFDDIDDLLHEYRDKCFLRLDGWWTYEFCFGKYVVQKHIIPADQEPAEGETEMRFVLGTLNKEADMVRRRNISEVSTKDAVFTQMFGNGTSCDKTKQPRRVMVKYMCSEDAVQISGATKKVPNENLNLLKSVREVESCVYELEFMNNAICRHATYKEKFARNARQIRCSLEHGQGVFQGLQSVEYQKASLNL